MLITQNKASLKSCHVVCNSINVIVQGADWSQGGQGWLSNHREAPS